MRSNFDSLAAVDLGSNSFHMVVARVVHGQPHILDRLRERVVLASGLTKEKRLSEDVQAVALECLERFGQRIRDMPRGSVRAVGTNALRQARNAREFLGRARKALGHPIEVISGHEEARLIYLGVAHTLADTGGRRLVVDIGGGSTECIIGERFEPLQVDSLYMGCVTWSRRFFSSGAIDRDRFRRAQIAAMLEFQPILRRYRALGWQECAGSSGTILACAEVLRQNGWAEGGITPKGLRRLRKALVAAGHADELRLPGLDPDRATSFAGGVAILLAAAESLGVDRMRPSTGALREGLLYDLLGRIGNEDVRVRTIRAFARRYHVDVEHAARVERTALDGFAQVAEAWALDEEARSYLSWAAQLHEIGLDVSYGGYHKHGAYLAANADMPGFSREDQEILAALIRFHRRKLGAAPFPDVPKGAARTVTRLGMLLRLAVVLHRSRTQQPLPPLRLQASEPGLAIAFPKGWLERHALTRTDLEEEAAFLREAGLALQVS